MRIIDNELKVRIIIWKTAEKLIKCCNISFFGDRHFKKCSLPISKIASKKLSIMKGNRNMFWGKNTNE